MNSFQIIFCVLSLLLLLGTIVAFLRGWIRRVECWLWCGVWLAATVAVIWPDVTSIIAKALGIGRGADLVSYCGVVVMLIGFWMLYIRLRRLRREFTLLVRKLAMLEALREYPLETLPAGAATESHGTETAATNE